MKLTDILREIEDEEGGSKQMKVQYDLAVDPSSLEDALEALNNIENYGIYAQNMRDPKAIAKAFGPSIPAQKAGAAWKDWDTRSDEEKEFKINDIKSRTPEAWDETVEKANPRYESWKADGNEGTIEDFLKSLPGKSLPIEFYGRYGKNYYPIKTPDNLKKYAGKLEKDVNYKVDNGKIIFPSSMENPFNTKSYLEKVLKTVFNNAGVTYNIIGIEVGDTDSPKTINQPKGDIVPPLSTTVNTADQADKLRKQLQAKLGDVKTAKYEIEPVGDGPERKYKLVVTGISADQRSKLQPIAFDFKQKINEESDFEMRQMLVRAGIIK